jgi:hypothetical protein
VAVHFLALAVEVDDAALPIAKERLSELAASLEAVRQTAVVVGPAPAESAVARAFATVADAERTAFERERYLAKLAEGDVVFWSQGEQLRCGRLVCRDNTRCVTVYADGGRIDVATELIVPLPVLDPMYGPV